MPKYWGFHQIPFLITEINRLMEGRERDFKEIPADAKIALYDVVFLFWSEEFLYGWGTVTRLGNPYINSSRQSVIDITINPIVLQQCGIFDDIKRTPSFRDFKWEKKNGVLVFFYPEQVETLISFLPRDRSRPSSPPKEIPEGWERVEHKENLRGNQGSVNKVRRKVDGCIGALKRLHQENQKNQERRIRAVREVSSLEELNGTGTPQVLESNVQFYKDKDVDLFVIMGWIEGPTLENYISKNKLSLDEAVVVTRALLQTLDVCHERDLFHRDLKHDNIILQDGNLATPIIIDFGMAFTKHSEDEPKEFKTAAGQELGNRFLRLPEYTSNQHSFSAVSDITVIVGLLFYMITGRPPRQLQDAQGRMPHEVFANSIPNEIRNDPRWTFLERLFQVGFQYRMDLRIQSSKELYLYLDKLTTPDTNQAEEKLAIALQRLNTLKDSDKIQLPKRAKKQIHIVSSKLYESLQTSAIQMGFGFANNGFSMIEENGQPGSNMLLNIYLVEHPSIGAHGSHTIRFRNNQYVAAYQIEQTTPVDYFRGSVVDIASFEDAVMQVVPSILSSLIESYYDKLKAE